MKYVSHDRSGIQEMMITVTWRDWLFRKRLGRYIGWCTVWYSYPEFKRAGTAAESELSGMWAKIQHEAPWHLRKVA